MWIYSALKIFPYQYFIPEKRRENLVGSAISATKNLVKIPPLYIYRATIEWVFWRITFSSNYSVLGCVVFTKLHKLS